MIDLRNAAIEDIVQNHRAVRRFLRDVRSEEDADEVAARLVEIRDLLPNHFHSEELPDGLLDRIKSLGPDGVRAAHRLRKEHAALSADLEALGEEPTRDEEWVARVRRFADLLAAHEAHEAGYIGRSGTLRTETV